MPDRPTGELKEQLSCLADSELDDSQARFLLKRLDHDKELRDCWERYHLVRSVMQDRQFDAAAGFGDRVSAAIAGESIETPPMSERVRRWMQPLAGAAIAASVALVAFNIWQQPAVEGVSTAPVRLVAQPTADLNGAVNAGSSQIAVPAAAGSGGRNATLQQYMIRHSQATSSVNGLQFVYVVSDTLAAPETETDIEPRDGDGQVAR